VRNGWIALLVVVGTALLVPRTPHAQKPKPVSTTWRTPWSYAGAKGPEHWGDLDPQYAPCKDGKEQSPIDIGETEKADLPSLRFEYHSGPLNVINNGHTALRVDYLHSGDFLVVGNQRYELSQFHFHRPRRADMMTDRECNRDGAMRRSAVVECALQETLPASRTGFMQVNSKCAQPSLS
jgi:carbonic anhydrase